MIPKYITLLYLITFSVYKEAPERCHGLAKLEID